MLGGFMSEDELIGSLTNKELVHKLKYTRTRAKDCIALLKELVVVNDRIKAELRMRLVDLQIETEIAESERIHCDDPFIDQLLDLH